VLVYMYFDCEGNVDWHNLRVTWPTFTKFLCMLPVVVSQSLCGSVEMYYVLPVLWMMS